MYDSGPPRSFIDAPRTQRAQAYNEAIQEAT
jgi:hypothetical protein